jgi:hypothetical protein
MRWLIYYALAAALSALWLRAIIPRIGRPLTRFSIVTLFLALSLSRVASAILLPCALLLILMDPLFRFLFRRVDAAIATDFIGVWQAFFDMCLQKDRHENRMSAPT